MPFSERRDFADMIARLVAQGKARVVWTSKDGWTLLGEGKLDEDTRRP